MGKVSDIRQAPVAHSVVPRAERRKVSVRVRGEYTPDEARELAVELLYAADSAQGGPDVDMLEFGYEADDSRALGDLRSLVVEHLGWGDDEQAIDQDFAERLQQVGKILKRQHLQVVKR